MRTLVRSVLAACALTASAALAHDYKAGGLKIDHPWSRATPGGAKVAAGYLSVTNTGSEPDTLTGGSLVAASRVEIHSMSMEGGIMKMAPVAGGLAIKPGQTVTLGPEGLHLMFLGLKDPLRKGERVKGTLVFEKAGTVEVEFAVEAIAAKTPGADAHQHDHH